MNRRDSGQRGGWRHRRRKSSGSFSSGKCAFSARAACGSLQIHAGLRFGRRIVCHGAFKWQPGNHSGLTYVEFIQGARERGRNRTWVTAVTPVRSLLSLSSVEPHPPAVGSGRQRPRHPPAVSSGQQAEFSTTGCGITHDLGSSKGGRAGGVVLEM